MTLSLLWHIIVRLACTLNDFCRIVTHWFLDMIYSFFPLISLLVLNVPFTCLYWQLCTFEYPQLISLLIVESSVSRQTTNYTQVWLCCKGHFNVRLIRWTSQGDSVGPTESWWHRLDLSHWESPNKQPEICWTQWRTRLKWQTCVLTSPVHCCSFTCTNINTSFFFRFATWPPCCQCFFVVW